jgi:hypothetical protein
VPGKVIGPGAQTSRPGDAGPVRGLRGGMASRAAFIFLLWYYPNLYATGHGSPQRKDPVRKSFSLKTAYRRRASGNGVSDYYDPAYGMNDFGNTSCSPDFQRRIGAPVRQNVALRNAHAQVGPAPER